MLKESKMCVQRSMQMIVYYVLLVFLFLSLSFNSVSFWRRVARSLGDCIEQNMSALYYMLKFILKYEYIT